MKAIRTPDAQFENLPDFPYAPHYLEWNGLRVAHIDEGPKDGPVALLMHGEPSWSYLYRKMIPGLVAAGYRCIAPDHVGFGRSDKPVDDNWYVIERHCERIAHLIQELDLQHITLFCQDWGGPIGLRQVVDFPEHFDRLAIMNTWLHHAEYEYSDGVKMWHDAATNPFWLAWMRGEFPVGRVMATAMMRPGHDSAAIEKAYEAPYTKGPESRAGARRFPWCLPHWQPEEGNAEDQQRCFNTLKTLGKPTHFIFGDADMVFTTAWGEKWAAQMPGSSFDTVAGAGHFLQEEAGEEIVDIFIKRRDGQ